MAIERTKILDQDAASTATGPLFSSTVLLGGRAGSGAFTLAVTGAATANATWVLQVQYGADDAHWHYVAGGGATATTAPHYEAGTTAGAAAPPSGPGYGTASIEWSGKLYHSMRVMIQTATNAPDLVAWVTAGDPADV